MVNDCAYVGETIAKYFPPEVSVLHLKRSRGLLDKTFGLAWKILRAKGDVYHVHYLLQDCYLASRLGKQPLIGHAHGSDLRTSLNHKLWGRIIKHNLKHCDKVLVSTPDILNIAKDYEPDAEYLPNPVDTSIFYPKSSDQHEEKLKVLIASGCDWESKGTEIAINALAKIKDDVEVFVIRYGKDFEKTLTLANSLGLRLHVLPRTSHEGMREYYWSVNLVIDQFTYGVLGMITLEAIASGRPVLTFASSVYDAYKDFPLEDVNTIERIAEAMKNCSQELWKEEYNYLTIHHVPEKIAKRVNDIYVQLMP
jgi:glycosyltransferase involved in cell wall biosynthesis